MHDGIIYRCDHCDYKNGRKQALNQHISSKHEGNIYKCDKCIQIFSYKPDLVIHTKYKHGVSNWKCSQCDLTCRKMSELKIHIKIVHEGFRYKCDKCSFEAKRLAHFKRHTKDAHKSDNILNCQLCSYKTSYERYLKIHRENEHSEHKFDESQGLKKITQVILKPKIRTSKKKSEDTNKSALNTGNKDSSKQLDDDQHISEEDAEVDITIADNDEATNNSKEEKVSQQESRKVTYLCPVY